MPFSHHYAIKPKILCDALGLEQKPIKPQATVFGQSGRVAVKILLQKAYNLAPHEGRNNTGFKLATWLRDNDYTREKAYSVLLEYCQNQQHHPNRLVIPQQHATIPV